MSRASQFRARRERYGLLFVAILTAFAIQGIATPGPWEQVAVTALLGATLVLALWAAEARHWVVRVAVAIALVVTAFSVVEAAIGKVDVAATSLANLLLMILAPPAIVVGVVRSLRAHRGVSIEAVFGVLCLYILLGMFFAGAYHAIDRLGHPILYQRRFGHGVQLPLLQLHDADHRGLRRPHGGRQPRPHAVRERGTDGSDLSGHDRLADRRQPASAAPERPVIPGRMTATGADSDPPDDQRRRTPEWLLEAERIDRAVYDAVADTPTPRLDDAMRRLSNAANYSRLSLAAAAVLATTGGPRGRRAARSGLTAVAGTATFVNVAVKPLGRRRRPERDDDEVAPGRIVRMPGSRSFPSGHTAAAVAFATGVSRVLPAAGAPLHLLAALVGYSRVHTGVHYPGDVVAGALLGAMIGGFTAGRTAPDGPTDLDRSSRRR